MSMARIIKEMKNIQTVEHYHAVALSVFQFLVVVYYQKEIF